jgi:hypothetical protein
VASQNARDSISWNEQRSGYDWATTLSDGRKKAGFAETSDEAKATIRSWHVTTLPPRHRGPRTLCGVVKPTGAKPAARIR